MKNLILLVVLMSSLGCARTTSNYYYASLENVPSIEVANREKVALDKLRGNTEIPTKYILNRNEYRLVFAVGSKSYFPHFKISVESLGGSVFGLEPKRITKIKSSDGNICASYYPDAVNPSALDFSWSTACISDDITKELSFKVVGADGTEIAQEKIPFVIKQDGKYTLLDAI